VPGVVGGKPSGRRPRRAIGGTAAVWLGRSAAGTLPDQTMNSLRALISRHPRFSDALRALVVRGRRWRHRLRRVDPTFYLSAGAIVCPDLVAHAFSYVGPGCRLGPQVELGTYAMLGPEVCIVGGD